MAGNTPPPANPPQGMSAEEYQRAQTTGEFLDAAITAESNINEMTDSSVNVQVDDDAVSIRRVDGTSGSIAWPPDRARKVVESLSKKPGGEGLDLDAIRKADRLRGEAHQENKNRDIVLAGGNPDKQEERDKRTESVLEGNNSVGGGPGSGSEPQRLGAMARGAGRKYDIKDGVAMRGRSDANKEGEYKPFAPQHQERAKELMTSLGRKQKERKSAELSAEEVAAAKEALARDGIKIPKPKTGEDKAA